MITLTVFDVDKSGYNDVILASSAGIRVFPNRGPIVYAPIMYTRTALDVPGTVLSAATYFPRLADVNGDGLLDVVLHGIVPFGCWFLNRNGSFFSSDRVSANLNPLIGTTQTTNPIWGQLSSNDTLGDFCFTSSATLACHYGNTGGTSFTFISHFTYLLPRALVFHDLVDLTGDLVDDIVTIVSNPGEFLLYISNGNRTLRAPLVIGVHNGAALVTRLTFGDLDNDGRVDLLYGDLSTSMSYWQRNLAAGSFGPAITIGSTTFNLNVRVNLVVDLVRPFGQQHSEPASSRLREANVRLQVCCALCLPAAGP